MLLANWQNFTLCTPHTSLCFATPSLATSQLITRALFATRVCSNARRLHGAGKRCKRARAHTHKSKNKTPLQRAGNSVSRKNFQLIKTNAHAARRSKARLCKHKRRDTTAIPTIAIAARILSIWFSQQRKNNKRGRAAWKEINCTNIYARRDGNNSLVADWSADVFSRAQPHWAIQPSRLDWREKYGDLIEKNQCRLLPISGNFWFYFK